MNILLDVIIIALICGPVISNFVGLKAEAGLTHDGVISPDIWRKCY